MSSVDYAVLIPLVILYDLLLPIGAILFIRCFYDDSVEINRRTLCISALMSVILDSSVDIYDIFVMPTNSESWSIIPYILFTLVEVFVFFYRKGKGIKYIFDTYMLLFIVMIIIEVVLIGTADIVVSVAERTGFKFSYIQRIMAILFLVIFIVSLVLRFARKKSFLEMRRQDNLMFLLYYVFLLFCDISNDYDYGWIASDIVFISMKSIMILIIIIIPVLIIKMRQTAYYNELSTRNEQFLEAELISSNAYRRSQEDTRAFRHDMNNNLALVSALMAKKDYAEAEKYINDLHGKLSSFSPRIVTGDDMLDALISSKLPAIEEAGIRFNISGVIDGGLSWKPIDICAVFANLLDNAAEACEKVAEGQRYITMNIQKTPLQRMITVSNSTSVKVSEELLKSGQNFTSKEDRSRHGFGIKNIRRTLEKNGAMLDITCTDAEFSAKMIFMR